MEQWQKRTVALIGEDNQQRLCNTKIVVLGLGGVGGSAAEALVRAGVGHLMLVDKDCFDETNINRQLLATTETIGKSKPSAAKERFIKINPKVDIICEEQFYLPDNSDFVFDFKPDYIIDAIDNVTAKLHLAKHCTEYGIPLISCLGTGNRLDPSKLRTGDISQTAGFGCPLARVIRRELKKLGVPKLEVVFSEEIPRKIVTDSEMGSHSPASIAFVPPSAGYLMAAVVVRNILGL
ncbi:MAG: tRNA threonylcarbamoyladenosine dehydratase [Oscillospiraceae bacterium]